MLQHDSKAWIAYNFISFAVALGMILVGIALLPVPYWVQGYFVMGQMFLIGTTITLSKILRDQHEAQRLINRIEDAKAEKILKEYEGSTL